MAEKHTILAGKVHVYKRENSPVWQCSTYLQGKNRRVSSKEESLKKAKDFAEDWYFRLRNMKAQDELVNEKTFADAAKQFKIEYEVMTEGERNARYVQDHYSRLRNYLLPYFGKMPLSAIIAGTVQNYRVFRLKEDPNYKPPSRSTMKHEIVTLRQVLKTALRHGWVGSVPDVSIPYSASGKVSHRAWFSSDEVKRLEYRDVEIVRDASTDQTILELQVRGKRGVGFCKSMTGAVLPFQRLKERNDPQPTDLLFPADHKKQFNRILVENDLKFDREGTRRTLYSLRHSYISFRLLEGTDIYQIAKNCRTSVEMNEKHYAVHLKNSIDALAINVRKQRVR